MKRIAIMGAGSMGMVLGAYIAKSGRQVDLIDVNQAHVEAMRKNGAKVVGFTEMTVPVTALTPDEMEGDYDIFFLMVKQTYNASAFASMKKHLAPDGIVVTLQNGLPEPACCREFGEEHVFGAPIDWGATWIGPGVSEITTPEDGGREFMLGSVSGKMTPELMEVKEILELMCPVQVSDNLMGLRWTKVFINATFSGMSAVIGGTFGDVMDTPAALYAVTFIGREAVRCAHASGVQLYNVTSGIDVNILMDFYSEEERQVLEGIYRKLFHSARALKASMLQDLEKGKKTEVDAIDGILCSVGREYGVPTPAADLVVEQVHYYEENKCLGTKENADIFLQLRV